MCLCACVCVYKMEVSCCALKWSENVSVDERNHYDAIFKNYYLWRFGEI